MHANIMHRPIAPEQAPRVHLARDVLQLGAPAGRHDKVAALLERGEVAHDLAAEEAARIQRRLAHQHARALGLHALHGPTWIEKARELSEPVLQQPHCAQRSDRGRRPVTPAWTSTTK